MANPSASVLLLEFKPKEEYKYVTRGGEKVPAATKDGYHLVSQSVVHYQEKEFDLNVNEKSKTYNKFFILDNIESTFAGNGVDFFEDHFGISYVEVYNALSKKFNLKDMIQL